MRDTGARAVPEQGKAHAFAG
jgi:hypothetical protein